MDFTSSSSAFIRKECFLHNMEKLLIGLGFLEENMVSLITRMVIVWIFYEDSVHVEKDISYGDCNMVK